MKNKYPKYEYYVMKFNDNTHIFEPWNIFNSIYITEQTTKTLEEYLKDPENFEFKGWGSYDIVKGYKGLCKEFDSIFMYVLWSRTEYEFVVSEMFNKENKQKVDCYAWCINNIELIVDSCIKKYDEWKKSKK